MKYKYHAFFYYSLLSFSIIINNVFSQEATESKINKRSVFPIRTSKTNLPFPQNSILFTGFQHSTTSNTYLIEFEKPLKKKISFEAIIGFENTISDERETVLSKNSLNLYTSTGVKFFLNDINRRHNWFFSTDILFVNVDYNAQHMVMKDWKWEQGLYDLYIQLLPPGWYAQDQHLNTYKVNATTFGVLTSIGYQIVLLNRIPMAFSTGLNVKHSNETLKGYEQSEPNPSNNNDKEYNRNEPSAFSATISFKLGYLIYKK